MRKNEAPKDLDEDYQGRLNEDLVYAAAQCSLADLKRLLREGADALHLDSSALCIAANEGSQDCVRALLPHSDAKADNCLALRSAAINGKHECVEEILRCRMSRRRHIGGRFWNRGRLAAAGPAWPC